MSPPQKLLPDGRLNPDWIETLNFDELSVWLKRLLNGRDTDIQGDPTTLIETILLDIYNQTTPFGKQALTNVLDQFVEDMARAQNSDWRGEPADRLLMVVGEIPHDCTAIKDHLIQMVDSGRYVNPEAGIPGDIHFRLLQTLVALGVRRDFSFWRREAQRCPQQYLGVACAGLALTSPARVIDLISDADYQWTERMEWHVRRVLDDMLQDPQNREALAKALDRCRPNAPESALPLLDYPEDELQQQGAQGFPPETTWRHIGASPSDAESHVSQHRDTYDLQPAPT